MSNTNTATAAARWTLEIEKHVETCEQIMMKAAADCAPYRKKISEAKAAAKNEGIGAKALNALLLERKHLRNAANVSDKLEDEDLVAELEMLRDQVPAIEGVEDLFAFARDQIDGEIKAKKGGAAAKYKQAKAAALDDLTDPFDGADPRPSHLREAHRQAEEEAAARNAAAIEGGIKPLH